MREFLAESETTRQHALAYVMLQLNDEAEARKAHEKELRRWQH